MAGTAQRAVRAQSLRSPTALTRLGLGWTTHAPGALGLVGRSGAVLQGSNMDTEPSAKPPFALTQDRLALLSEFMPSKAVVIGGLHAPYANTTGVSESAAEPRGTPPKLARAAKCVLVFYALDDHTIHKAEVCGGGTDFEIVSDSGVGSW